MFIFIVPNVMIENMEAFYHIMCNHVGTHFFEFYQPSDMRDPEDRLKQ